MTLTTVQAQATLSLPPNTLPPTIFRVRAGGSGTLPGSPLGQVVLVALVQHNQHDAHGHARQSDVAPEQTTDGAPGVPLLLGDSSVAKVGASAAARGNPTTTFIGHRCTQHSTAHHQHMRAHHWTLSETGRIVAMDNDFVLLSQRLCVV